MNFELHMLAGGLFLWLIQLVAMAYFSHLQLGADYLMGPRDAQKTPAGLAGRLRRAYDNHKEWTLFHGLVTALVIWSDSASGFTAACAGIWLAARVVYAPLYATGSTPWRTVAFGVGFLASVAMLVAALL